ncbi:MAG: nuclear transport factor 2 family protein [Deltaproteobacteria bacterium]|nr:nuclear transport factor 2 family protein [Deltaproteobacteria bacterium]
MRTCSKKIFFLAVAFTIATSTLCQAQSDQQTESDLVLQNEITRIKALVDRDIEFARQLFAEDFQFINPSGNLQIKKQFLEGLASGEFYC